MESQWLREMLNPQNFIKNVGHVICCLQLEQSAVIQPNPTMVAGQDTATFIGKPFLQKPRHSLLSSGGDRSVNPELFCQHCKDTGHVKENCMLLNRRLAKERQEAKRA